MELFLDFPGSLHLPPVFQPALELIILEYV